MKSIEKQELPIGNKNYTTFFSEDILKETDKAILVSIYFESVGGKVNKWLPKSKILFYSDIDNRDLIDNGKDYVINPNYGKPRVRYFIPTFFTKDNGCFIKTSELSELHKNSIESYNDNNVLGVKGIDY